MPDIDDPDRQYAALTPKDRRFLLAEGAGYDRRQRHDRKASIVPRTRHTLTDLRLNADKLPSEWYDDIFDADPGSPEYDELQKDIEGLIAFLYSGLGGGRGFRNPLVRGVSRGEKMLGHVDYSFQVEPRFAVDIVSRSDKKEVVDAVRQAEWDRLDRNSIFSFIELATYLDAIDFDAIEEYLEKSFEEQAEEWAGRAASVENE